MYFSFKHKSLFILYNILTYILGILLKIIGLFNIKIHLGVKGRARSIKVLMANINDTDKVVWFHCASLGEYEQGLPVFKEIKAFYPNHKIVLSFFSPSGFEIRKINPITDIVVYLPLDSAHNARAFLDKMHPELVIFVKYEIWPNYLKELNRRKIRAILISAVFRKEQQYFRFYGSWIRKSINAFDHIFVQNSESRETLNYYGFNNITMSGDTRFDRVYDQLSIDNSLESIAQFKEDKLCIVAGSTWPEDEALFIDFINRASKDLKFIIAPHNIKPNRIIALNEAITKSSLRYSEIAGQDLREFQVLIIDSIGLLSRIFSYSDIAYVGGAYGTTGLHNTLEAAVFAVPIIIGTNYQKFPEAHDMIKAGGMYAISDQKEFNSILNLLISNEDRRTQSGTANKGYILKNKGAVIQIMDYIRT